MGVLLSMLVAALAFILFFAIGNFLLDHTVYGQDFAERMADRSFEKLQDFVTQEEITPQKLRRLNAWCASHESAYLSLYIDGEPVYESPIREDQEPDLEDSALEMENADQRYELTLSDGTVAEAFLYYFAAEAFYIWMSAISAALAFAVFSICFITLVHRKLRYIQKLKQELDILAGGELDYEVTVRGTDELGELASGIDNMRRSILNHQRAEDEMRAANSQLVTAMSHDLRTPLTSLMAYLELLDRDKANDEAQRKHLIHQSLSKVQSIKEMADKLFEYFLVYTSEWEQPEFELVDADEVMLHYWQEYAFSLESRGYTVHTRFYPLQGQIAVNTALLQRAFDNLFGNLLKYADDRQPIDVAIRRVNNEVQICVTNKVSPARNQRQNTNIGLNTCKRILSIHNGSFRSCEEGNIFSVELSLPVVLVGENGRISDTMNRQSRR